MKSFVSLLIALSIQFGIHNIHAQILKKESGVKINTDKGDILTDKSTKNVNNNYSITVKGTPNEKDILNLQNSFDLEKDILVMAGNNKLRLHPPDFAHGVHPLGELTLVIPGGYEMLYIKIIEGQIKISAVIRDFRDKVVAKIVNNELLSKGFNKYAGLDYFEVFDDYNIPVLQVYTIPKENKLVVNGAFNYAKGYYILSDKGIHANNFPKEKLMLKEEERDSLELVFRKHANDIKPIHE